MGTFNCVAKLDNLRSLAFADILATYVAVGLPFAHACRLICITNNTNGDVFFSNDGVNDKLFLAAMSFKLFDVSSNRETVGNQFVLPINTQFYVRYSTAPTAPPTGAVYIEVIY